MASHHLYMICLLVIIPLNKGDRSQVAKKSAAVQLVTTEEDARPEYAYEYAVNDPSTRDIKKHWEKRDGEHVQGAYSLVEPDETIRAIEYTADNDGFKASVKKLGTSSHSAEFDIFKPIANAKEAFSIVYRSFGNLKPSPEVDMISQSAPVIDSPAATSVADDNQSKA